VARSLKNKKTLTVGLVAPEIANVFFMQVAQGVEDRLTERGYSLMVVNSMENADRERATVDLLLEKQIDGIILIPAGGDGKHLGGANLASTPVVLVDRLVSDFETDSVLVDNEDATFRAVSELCAQGRNRFGFIGGQNAITTARERYEGFLRATETCGVPLPERHVRFGDFHTESGYTLFAELMQLPDPPTTVMIANYFMQIGALRYAAAHRDSLPQDLYLASFDSSEVAAVAGIPCLSIVQPINEIGRRAADLLLGRMDGSLTGRFRVERLRTSISRPQ
jgi:LacI family transcriptional regulator